MQRVILAIAALAASSMISASAFAGACSNVRANDLSAFDGCMVPVRGSIMTAQVGTASRTDPATQKLLAAMHKAPVVPPHVISAPTPFPMFATMAIAAAYRKGNRSYNPYWNWWTMQYAYYLSH